jgi:hypothetical protein
MKGLDEIIAERTEGLPPEQQNDVARRTIIEILMTQPEVPLTGLIRLYVATELERLWLSKRELAKINRQRLLKSVEESLEVARWARKNIWPKRGNRPQPTAIAAVAEVIWRDDLRGRFPSTAALEQFLKRERQAKKKRRR